MDVKHKFGFYRKTKDIPEDWGRSDYLINNNVIRLTRLSLYPLVPFTAKKNIVIRYVLYAAIEMHNQGHTRFGYNDLLIHIQKNRAEYDKLIKKKLQRITEVIESSKYNRGIHYFKNLDKSKQDLIMKQVIKKSIDYDKNAKMKKDDVYFALGLLLGNFLELKYIINKRDPEKFEDKKPNEKYYYLSADGKSLAKKFYTEKYLI